MRSGPIVGPRLRFGPTRPGQARPDQASLLIVDLNVRSELNSMDSSLVNSAAIASKQAAGLGRKKQAAAVLVNFIAKNGVQ